jgi:hypothetical protein
MRKNTPITVSYTKLGQKVYSGDLIPIAANRQTRRSFTKNPNKNTNNAKINKCRRKYIELRPIAKIFEKIKELEFKVIGFRKPTLINHYKTKLFR